LLPRILLLGHRGARRYAPDNTFGAFDLALEQGADGFEFDVRLTRNRRMFICHDPKFHRLSVRRSTLKQLQSVCSAPEPFPLCLEDVLQRYAGSAFLNLEVKVRGMERLVQRIFRRFPPKRGYFISSFLPGVLRELHRIDDSLLLGTLSQTRWQLRRWDRLPAAYVLPKYRLLSRRLVEEVHAAKKLVVTWTVNEPKHMLRAAELGADGIISDDPKLLRKTLSEVGSEDGFPMHR
jgi:glycerophosphoryl diester phosphodiesterase